MVSERKKKWLEKIKEILKSYKTVILFDLNKLPAKQLHIIRNKLKASDIYTIISKKRILELAIKENNINLNLGNIKQPGLIYSNKNIFEIIKAIKNIKVKRKAKAGEVAPENIEVPAGDTGIQTGPAISIFKQFKIQTMIKDGKIAIKEPTIVCQKGDKISMGLVSLLNMLGIEPIEMKLEVENGFSDGIFYSKDILSLDEEYFKDNIAEISEKIFKLTLAIGYPTKYNIIYLLQKALFNTRNLGITLGIPAKDLITEMLRLAQYNAIKLSNL
jgi:large subunit ribosomal protein L10